MFVGQEKKFEMITARHDHKAEDDFDLGTLLFPMPFLWLSLFRFPVVRFAFASLPLCGPRYSAYGLTDGRFKLFVWPERSTQGRIPS
jgi:hypothetical protein